MMSSGLGLGLMLGGVALMIFGFNEAESAASEISEFFTGNPTDRAMWMIIGGLVAMVVGLISFLRGRARP